MILSSSFPDKTSEFQMEQKINDQCNFKSAKRLDQPIRPLTHKKGALSSLIERVEMDFIQDMINSPQKRKHQRMMKKVGKLSESKNHKKNEIAPDSHRIGPDILRQGRCLSEQNSNKKSISSTNQTQLFQNFSIEQQSTIIQKLNSEKIQELRKTSKFCQEKDHQSQLSHDSENKSHLVNEQTSCVDQQIGQIKLQDLDFISESTVTPEGSQDEKPDSKSQQKPFLHIDDFQQISILGQGVYGKVSLARHKKTNLVLALKKIDKNNLNKEDSTYLSREIKIQSYADHPNIVQLYSFFHDESNIYLVLEVCNQGNLFSILQKLGGSIQEDKVKKYIRQICKAVQFLHYNEIIHRDLKPQNILVHNGVAKICDFGWAVHAPELRSTLCGTPLYSCPQIVKNQKYDQKIDIWSIGVMTYELIFGTTPFDIKYQEDLSKVIDNTVQYPPNCMISEECKNFINGCLEKHPKDRFQIWELLRHPFICEEEKIRDSLRVCF